MSRMIRVLACALGMLAACEAGGPPPPQPSCDNPRSAADSLFVWQQADYHDLSLAVACLDTPPGGNPARLAVRLKQVLDARGLYVPVSSMSDDPEFVDAAGLPEVRPLPDKAPWLMLRRNDGDWQYSQSTLAAVPALYAETFPAMSLAFQDALPSFFMSRPFGIYLWQLLYAALLAGLSWLTGLVVRAVARDQAVRLARRSGLPLDLELWARTNRPLMALAMLSVVLWGLPLLQLSIALSQSAFWILDLSWKMAAVVLALRLVDVVGSLGMSWAGRTESKLDDQLIPLIRQASGTLVIGGGSLLLLEALGVDIWKLMAGVGIGGLAFALAAQDTVANLFGSVNIFIDRPFQIGDWVEIGGVEGVVEEVGFRSTKVRTFYNSVVVIPNSKITNANVDNFGRRHRRRIKHTIGLTYSTSPASASAYVEGVKAILQADSRVDPSEEVHMHNLGNSALEIMVYYHLVVPGWSDELATRGEHLLEFMRLAERLEVSFAFPSTSVYVESMPTMEPSAA